jgi:hypothetical protein
MSSTRKGILGAAMVCEALCMAIASGSSEIGRNPELNNF